MKKVFSFLAIAAVLAVSACNKSAEGPSAKGDTISVHYRVGTEFGTKATSNFGTGSQVDYLKVEVYRVVDEMAGTYAKTAAVPTITKVTNGEWDVDLKLAKSYKYRIAFWAHQTGNGIYDVTSLDNVVVDYSAIAINSDKADAFCAARVLEVSGALTETVELYRPLAQFNMATSDRTEYLNSLVSSDVTTINAGITVKKVPSVINVLGGAASADGKVSATTSTPLDVTFPAVVVLNVDDKISVSSVDYEYLSMVYVLAGKDSALLDFTATITNGTKTVNTVALANVPYQANYRTNIVGQLLTGNLHYDVVVVPAFHTPDYSQAAN